MYLLPVVCSVIGICGVLASSFIVVFHVRQERTLERTKAHAKYVEQRANNENEENLRRFKNPLFLGTSKDLEKSTKSIKDEDKLEKSPMHKPESINETTSITPKKTKTKDINIELSKSSSRAAEQKKELIEISRTIGVELESEVVV